jgi:hypothetical protein
VVVIVIVVVVVVPVVVVGDDRGGPRRDLALGHDAALEQERLERRQPALVVAAAVLVRGAPSGGQEVALPELGV